MNENDVFDVTIIGGGPAGLYSAFYSGLRGMKTKIIEFQPELGGKVHAYPEKMIWDVGGQPPILGEKFIDQIVQQGLTFHPEVVLNEKVTSISKSGELFVLNPDSDKVHYSKTVIVAVGSGILKPQKLAIEGAEKYEVSNLHYTVKSLQMFKDKTVFISGGGNAALDWAVELQMVAKEVFLVHRKDQFTAHEAQVNQIINSSVQCYMNSTISKLLSDESHQKIEMIEINHLQSNEKKIYNLDELVISHGYEQDSSLLKNSQLEIEMLNGVYIAGNVTSESSVPGLYAAGDILHHEGKVHLIAGAFQDAANAVNKAKQYIQPEAEAHAMVSSHNEIFKEKNRELVKKMVR
ncbi:NAD(P)/FAD-dependent oxidoreductase [Bacillus sp. 2205SS5-2]|uniref:NAD(P)/FAD-dependent oxidoreductase n=1 Tax=Bacillus sp. 2205SS5-2 TaxID=3109031 RepID=UPI003006834D